MNISTELLIAILVPILSAFAGYLVSYLKERKKDLRIKANEERRAIYQDFVNLMIDQIVYGDNITPEQLQHLNAAHFEFYKRYALYATPNVIDALADLKQYQFTSQEQNLNILYKKIGSVLVAMREDLGLSNSGLGDNGEIILKTFLSNYEAVMDEDNPLIVAVPNVGEPN